MLGPDSSDILEDPTSLIVEAKGTGHALLSFVDGFSGYNQISVAPEDQEKTTFVTEWGTYCYVKMPFGLKNAGSEYEACIVGMEPAMALGVEKLEVIGDSNLMVSQANRDWKALSCGRL
ncbi:uncharacterized protein LOC131298699 [Rhododendron vialii]|uniref:uncharacterized protein LOC131298699 n=1 Tax=Rhododendron vialii TaxID=182163 RepID=UPI00265F927F|nr:uncharacterized protein LOC131298699 [Rhododendron vialii]